MQRESRPGTGAVPTMQTVQNPPRLVSFLRELAKSDLVQGQTCRREYRRHSLRTSLTIQPLTADFQPDGEPFEAVSSDVSFNGMAFAFPDPIEHDHVQITFNNFEISAIGEVRHNSSIGVDYPLFLVGVKFIEEYYE